MQPIILFRKNKLFEKEIDVCKNYFDVFYYRTDIPKDSLVIPRFFMLPYPEELEQDIKNLGSKLINTAAQHRYIAQFDYYYDVEDFTPKTWFRFEDVPLKLRNSPLIIKGKTNSKKFQWKEKMFCENFSQAVIKGSDLLMDSAISEQGIIIRQYESLETFEVLDNGLPITNEWRVFMYKEEILAYNYYWSIIEDKSIIENSREDFEKNGLQLAREIAKNINCFVDFFVLDIAKKENGQWILIEINDGCQSGLNESVDPDVLYKNLSYILSNQLKMKKNVI